MTGRQLEFLRQDFSENLGSFLLLQAYGNGASTSFSRHEITVNGNSMDGRISSPEYYTHTEESRAFQQEFELAKQRQDLQLENIERGLNTLKGVLGMACTAPKSMKYNILLTFSVCSFADIGEVMGETLQQHDVLIDAIDEKMDTVTKSLTTNNMKLKGIVTKVRLPKIFLLHKAT